jgi:hypothetical protein
MGAAATVPKENKYAAVPVSVDELLRVVQTGDLLFFRGNSWQSMLERLFIWCSYSHVGMVEWRVLPGHTVATACLWESVGHLDAHTCVLHGRRKTGVRLVRLADKLADYIAGNAWRETHVCLVQLHARNDAARADMTARMSAFIDQVCGCDYSTHAIDIMRSQFPSMLGSATPASAVAGYTCNQLATATLVRMHAYSSATPAAQITLAGLMDGALLAQWQDKGALDQINYHYTVRPNGALDV